MKILITTSLLLVLAGLGHSQDTNLSLGEKAFEAEFGIVYADKTQEKKAADILAETEKEINEHNEKFKAGESTYYETLYSFADLPSDVFNNDKLGEIPRTPFGRALGLINPKESELVTDPELEEFYQKMARQAVPDSYDSLAKGLVTPAKNQLSCGSCSAFAATGVIETCMLKGGARMNGLDLSEQYLVDCGYDGNSMNGCKGAVPGAYVELFGKKLNQAPHEVDYPYLDTSPKLTCPKSPKIYNSGAQVTQGVKDYQCNEEKMKQLVFNYGAVQTGIYASDKDFDNTGNGIFSKCSSKQTNHAVVVVGYGTENGVQYWKVKNSWGDNWGDKGFVKIRRGSGECGIGSTCTVATCGKTTGKPSDPPVTPAPKPIPPNQLCDVTKSFGANLTGNFKFRYNNYEAEVTCTNSVCRPSIAGPSNACMYICGKLTC